MNLILTFIGVGMMLLGVICLSIKANSEEYIDESGMLHEKFFLLPIAFLLLFGGFVVFFVTGIRGVMALINK